jgi:hypothetical protein
MFPGSKVCALCGHKAKHTTLKDGQGWPATAVACPKCPGGVCK